MGQMWLTLPIYTSLSSKRFVPGNISQSRSFLLVLYEVSSKTVFSFHKLHGAAFVILVVLQTLVFSLLTEADFGLFRKSYKSFWEDDKLLEWKAFSLFQPEAAEPNPSSSTEASICLFSAAVGGGGSRDVQTSADTSTSTVCPQSGNRTRTDE